MSSKKLPLKSIYGRTCLSKCYPKLSEYVHPVILTGVTNPYQDSCAIDPIYKVHNDAKTDTINLYNMLLDDECLLKNNDLSQLPDELDSMMPRFNFNASDFLSSIYDLHTFDQVIHWTLENSYLPFDTIKRVNNCAWKAFGNQPGVLSNIVLDYYYEIAKNYWMHDYVDKLQTRYKFNLTTTTSSLDAKTEIYKIVISKFFDYDFFETTVKQYIQDNLDKWETIKSHYGNLKKYVFNKLITNISVIINSN